MTWKEVALGSDISDTDDKANQRPVYEEACSEGLSYGGWKKQKF